MVFLRKSVVVYRVSPSMRLLSCSHCRANPYASDMVVFLICLIARSGIGCVIHVLALVWVRLCALLVRGALWWYRSTHCLCIFALSIYKRLISCVYVLGDPRVLCLRCRTRFSISYARNNSVYIGSRHERYASVSSSGLQKTYQSNITRKYCVCV